MTRILSLFLFCTFLIYCGCKSEASSDVEIEYLVDSTMIYKPDSQITSWYENWQWKDSMLSSQMDRVPDNKKKIVIYRALKIQMGYEDHLTKSKVDSFILMSSDLEPDFTYYAYMNSAVLYWGIDWNIVLSAYWRSKDLGDSIFFGDHRKFEAYRWLGHIYANYKINLDSAEYYFNHILKSEDSLLVSGRMKYDIYSDLIYLYSTDNDSQRAGSYAELALEEAIKNKLDSDLINDAYARLGNVYYEKRDLNSARTYYEKHTGNNILVSRNLAVIYSNLKLFRKADRLIDSIYPNPILADDKFHFNRLKAHNFFNQNNNLEAAAYFKNARMLDTAFGYLISGDVYISECRALSSLHRYEEALNINNELLIKINFDWDKPELFRADIDLLQALAVRTRILLNNGMHNKSTESLLEVLKVYNIVKEILFEYRATMDRDSYLNAIANYYEANENAIYALFVLYNSKGNSDDLNRLIEEMESFKGSLLRMDRKMELLESSNERLSPLLTDDHDLKLEINRLKTEHEINPSKKNKELLLKAISEKKAIQKQFKSDFPDIHSEIFTDEHFGLENFKRLAV